MLLNHPAGLPHGCISDLVFDAWRAGELDEHRRRELAEHLAACRSCLVRQRALQSDADAFSQRVDHTQPLERVRVRLKQRTRRRRVVAWSATAVAALCLIIGIEQRPESFEVRRKGDSAIGAYVLRDDQLFRWQPGIPVRPGDRLRFTWRSDQPVYLAIVSLDARGVVSTYYPPTDRPRERLPSGTPVELPLAVELDATLGSERVFVLGCASPPDVEAVRRTLAQARELRAPASCELRELVLFKEARP